MKRLSSALMAFLIFLSLNVSAQAVKKSQQSHSNVAKTEMVKTESAKKDAVKKDKKESKEVVSHQAKHVKKDGTPDKRYKANKHLKKDGTPDKRFKGNK